MDRVVSVATGLNISPSFGEFTAPLGHILPIHNVTTNSNSLFVNFRWTFTFCVEKSSCMATFSKLKTLDVSKAPSKFDKSKAN